MNGYCIMRYDLDFDGNEVSGQCLCASTSKRKLQKRLERVVSSEREFLGEEEELFDYGDQVVIRYGGTNGDEIDGCRFIIEYVEIL